MKIEDIKVSFAKASLLIRKPSEGEWLELAIYAKANGDCMNTVRINQDELTNDFVGDIYMQCEGQKPFYKELKQLAMLIQSAF